MYKYMYKFYIIQFMPAQFYNFFQPGK